MRRCRRSRGFRRPPGSPQPGLRTAVRGLPAPWSAIVGSPVRDGADLLPTPRPGDRSLLLQLRAADLSRLHDADAGWHALPRVRPPAHQSDQGRGRPGPLRHARDLRSIALNVAAYFAEIAAG